MNITKQIEIYEDEEEGIDELESDDEIDSPNVEEIMEEGFLEQLLEKKAGPNFIRSIGNNNVRNL
ncbi:hypothetical protein EPI10_024727 [Gossypium australe]|uniref:Uncharacterized protein n=1 Tax=Gossypium australe TaxID=47621 RepID=A0A5B6VZU3_9ROSI|nr:hypothetical protein EPI10_024727 [Gossypium australe]